MTNYHSLNHSKWACQDHVIPQEGDLTGSCGGIGGRCSGGWRGSGRASRDERGIRAYVRTQELEDCRKSSSGWKNAAIRRVAQMDA